MKENLGRLAKCKITGYSGVIISYAEYISGEQKYEVQKQKEDEMIGYMLDIQQVEVGEPLDGFEPTIPEDSEFEVGDKVKDIETNIKGTISTILYFANGCIRYRISHPPLPDTGNIWTEVYSNCIKRVGKKLKHKEPKETGGPIEKGFKNWDR